MTNEVAIETIDLADSGFRLLAEPMSTFHLLESSPDLRFTPIADTLHGLVGVRLNGDQTELVTSIVESGAMVFARDRGPILHPDSMLVIRNLASEILANPQKRT